MLKRFEKEFDLNIVGNRISQWFNVICLIMEWNLVFMWFKLNYFGWNRPGDMYRILKGVCSRLKLIIFHFCFPICSVYMYNAWISQVKYLNVVYWNVFTILNCVLLSVKKTQNTHNIFFSNVLSNSAAQWIIDLKVMNSTQVGGFAILNFKSIRIFKILFMEKLCTIWKF